MNPASTGSHLIIESANSPPFSLPAGARVVIGRSRSADLPLNDLSISREHCALTARDGGFHIEDLGSASGTFVNGRRIDDGAHGVARPTRLSDGDRIRVGNTTLRFVSGEAKAKPPALYRQAAMVDPELTVVGRAGPAAAARPTTEPPPSIPLRERLVIGRDPGCDVTLVSRDISRRHAEIRLENGAYTVRDLASTNGTFLDGRGVVGRLPLREGSRLRIGAYTFQLRDARLWPACEKGRVRLSVCDVSKTIMERGTGRVLTLLDKINLVVEPNEFVALLGASGSGKSTLMNAMSGRRPASGGWVLINGEDFYANQECHRRTIGHVPQKEIVHTTLTVQQALTFAAQLRLPADTSGPEIERIVSEVIEKIGLSERRGTIIGSLSGGQLKRVSVGVELIADPSLLFLDEATSGLDAGTEARLMGLFRAIANEGKTVVCITHNVENVSLCDLVAVLAGGKLVFYGPPADLPGFFGVSKIGEIYDRLESQPPEVWDRKYQASPYHERYVLTRLKADAPSADALARESTIQKEHADKAVRAPGRETFDEMLRQMRVLIRRYATVLLQDRKNVTLLLAQAPLIGLLLGMVFGSLDSVNPFKQTHQEGLVVFLMAISAVWFGCINASREIVKELPIYLRERAVNLDLGAYLGSKISVLSVLCVVQCVAMYVVVVAVTGLKANVIGQVAALTLTAWCGMVMGLLVSALVDNADKAMAIVPLLLIPQVIFSNPLTELSGLTQTIGYACASFWSVDAMLGSLVSEPGTRVAWGANVFALVILILIFVGGTAWALKRKDELG